MHYTLKDTIAAVSTPPGESGIGIVRLSGKEALSIADRIFVSKEKMRPSNFKTYTTHYGWIVENIEPRTAKAKFKAPQDLIDEVILTVMRSPRSYTKEDVVEINCHGGIVALRKVLDLVLSRGCRLAEPGEFTKRAFLNGRIDLAQAEAVLDIIKAKSESGLKIGMEQLRGGLSKEIDKIRRRLLDILTLIEANIDFPDEEIDTVNSPGIQRNLTQIKTQLSKILDTSGQGKILREGINLVICGRPNVGKSSLLNTFLKQERSIVTHIAGTTRDTVEEIIDIKGIPVKIVDTAGIIEPRDIIERKAIRRSKKFIEAADLVILLFDGSNRISYRDRLLIKKLSNKPILPVINKIDLKQKINKRYLIKHFREVVEISCLKNKNIELLEDKIVNFVWEGKINSREPIFVSNIRHIRLLEKVLRYITDSLSSCRRNLSLEFIAQDIKQGLLTLDEISGKRFVEELLDRIFSQFCIGK